MNLTNEQIEAVVRGEAVPLIIEQTNCVVVRADIYQRVKAVLDDGLESDQVRQLIDQNMQEYDGADTLLESYQRYR